MFASFMVDPLGLELIDRIGVDRVMWSTDFPHNESTYGYSSESLASVVDAVGAEAATAIVSDNIKRYLGVDELMPAGLMATAPPPDPADAGLRPDAAGPHGAAAGDDAPAGPRRPGPARQHQCRLRHRRHLAAGRFRPGQLRAAGRRRPGRR